MNNIERYIREMPKAELHIHIEGSFEPELMFRIARRNNITIPYKDVDSLRAAYRFSNLQEFLDIYYEGASVLLEEQDFYDLTMAYLHKAHADKVMHTEIFFDPQTHTARGVAFDTVASGITRAMEDAHEKLGISSFLILSFLRHLSEEESFKTLEQANTWRHKIIGVGLDSSEVGNPPEKFAAVFAQAKEQGYKLMAHAGEEGPPEYIRGAVETLNVHRIDHGNRCLEDENLVQEIVEKAYTLTVCPLSNDKLQVVKNMQEHPLATMLDKGIKATVNSDDPAYFGGYMNDNFIAIQKALNLNRRQLYTLAKNAFEGSFLDEPSKMRYLKALQEFDSNFKA